MPAPQAMMDDKTKAALKEEYTEEQIEQARQQANQLLLKASELFETTPEDPIEKQLAELREIVTRLIADIIIGDQVQVRLHQEAGNLRQTNTALRQRIGRLEERVAQYRRDLNDLIPNRLHPVNVRKDVGASGVPLGDPEIDGFGGEDCA